ncbi:MAG TPA: hypothetical protein VH934_17495 [Xanthobacteraceae bacterium]|jgi:hypothetical protein
MTALPRHSCLVRQAIVLGAARRDISPAGAEGNHWSIEQIFDRNDAFEPPAEHVH